MAAAPSPPSPDDVSSVSGALQWIRDWGWSILGGFGFPAAWHIASRVTKIEERLEQHAKKFDEQSDANRETRERLDNVADKEDVRDMKAEIKGDIRDLRQRIDAALSRQPINISQSS